MIGLGLGASHSALLEATAPGGAFDTKAIEFDGASLIIVAAPASVDIFNGSGGSISFWAKDDPFTGKTFINKYASASENWRLDFRDSLLFFKAAGTGRNSWYSDAITGTLGAYNHYCSVDDSSTSNFEIQRFMSTARAGPILGCSAHQPWTLIIQGP